MCKLNVVDSLFPWLSRVNRGLNPEMPLGVCALLACAEVRSNIVVRRKVME